MVRYTSYTKDGKVASVQQVPYGKGAEDLKDFDFDTTTALEMGIDVSILTKVDVKLFPQLSVYCQD